MIAHGLPVICGGNIRVDRDHGLLNGDLAEKCFQFFLGGFHEGSVKGAGNRKSF